MTAAAAERPPVAHRRRQVALLAVLLGALLALGALLVYVWSQPLPGVSLQDPCDTLATWHGPGADRAQLAERYGCPSP